MNKFAAPIAIAAGLTLGAIGGFGALPLEPATATQPAFICPETGGGWLKVDGIDSPTALAIAPEGSLIAEVCYKAGTNQATYLVGPIASTLIVSTLVNNGGQVADISHYSIRLVPVPESTITPTPTPTPTSTPTPTPTPTGTPTPEPTPTRTTEPTPFPLLEPPTTTELPNTGLEGWAPWVLAVGLALVGAGGLLAWSRRGKA